MVVFFAIGFGFLNFFSSHYLNAEVDSSHRATVLSFKGLALNLGFGGISLLYGGILRHLQLKEGNGGDEVSETVFRDSLYWLPWIFIVMLAGLLLYSALKVKKARLLEG